MSHPVDMNLYNTIIQKFIESRTNDGRVNPEKFAQAAIKISPLYDRIFGTGFVSKYLRNDLEGHGNKLIKAVNNPLKPEYLYVDSMVAKMLQEKPISQIRGVWGEGIVELLWVYRALAFIVKLLSYAFLIRVSDTLYNCAVSAYTEILKPYHGILVSSIVSLAFNLVPSREVFLKNLGFNDLETAQSTLKQFIAAIQPTLNHVYNVLIQHDCDFPDVV